MTKEEVLSFIKGNHLAVVATSNANGTPQAAVVEFGELNDFTIIIDTLSSSRKYKNLKTNKNVAIVIGWDNDITVQIDALAIELSGGELEQAKRAYFKKNTRAKKWQDMPNISYFAFKPKWLRYSDLSKDPWYIKELSF
jgi:general stress protein 26